MTGVKNLVAVSVVVLFWGVSFGETLAVPMFADPSRTDDAIFTKEIPTWLKTVLAASVSLATVPRIVQWDAVERAFQDGWAGMTRLAATALADPPAGSVLPVATIEDRAHERIAETVGRFSSEPSGYLAWQVAPLLSGIAQMDSLLGVTASLTGNDPVSVETTTSGLGDRSDRTHIESMEVMDIPSEEQPYRTKLCCCFLGEVWRVLTPEEC